MCNNDYEGCISVEFKKPDGCIFPEIWSKSPQLDPKTMVVKNMQFKFVFINVSESLSNLDLEKITKEFLTPMIKHPRVPLYQVGTSEESCHALDKIRIGSVGLNSLKKATCGFLAFHLLDMQIDDGPMLMGIADLENMRSSINRMIKNSVNAYGILPNSILIDYSTDFVIDLMDIKKDQVEKLPSDILDTAYVMVTANHIRNQFIPKRQGSECFQNTYLNLYHNFYGFKDVRFVTTNGMSMIEIASIHTDYA